MDGTRSVGGPAPDIPPGITRLLRIGEILAGREWPELPALRVILTVPTSRFAGLALALGATRATAPCSSACGHAQLDTIPRLAACYFDRHLQDLEARLDSAGVHIGQSTFTQHFDSVHRLPCGFPERDPLPRNTNSHSDAEIKDLAGAFAEEEYVAGFRRSAMSAHPVLYVGDYTELQRDIYVASQTPSLSKLHPLGNLAPGKDYPSWFRHPVIAVTSAPDLRHHSWLFAVRPRLVVGCGYRSLLKLKAGIWDTVPHVALLSRRSPSSVNAVRAIQEMRWRRVSRAAIDDELGTALQPGDGLEIGCFCAPDGKLGVSQEEADDEW